MSYVVRELPRSGSSDIKGINKYVRTFQVQSDIISDAPGDIAAAISIPNGTSYPTDALSVLKDSDFRQNEDLFTWTCTYNYDNEPDDAGEEEEQAQEAPDERTPVVKYSTVEYEKVLTKDLDGKAAVSTNGEPFSDGLTIPSHYGSISLDFIRTFAEGAGNFDWTDRVNNAAWTFDGKTYAQYTLLVKTYDVEKRKEQGAYWNFKHIELLYNEEKWIPLKKLAVGTYEKVQESMSAPPKIVPIMDESGGPISQPALLNADGKRLNSGADPVYVDFRVYYVKDFDNLLN